MKQSGYRNINSFLTLFLISLIPAVALASGGETPISSGLSYLIDAMLGKTGMTIATLAIMGVGLACLWHKMEWSAFGYTIAAVSIVFGAPMIISGIHSLVR